MAAEDLTQPEIAQVNRLEIAEPFVWLLEIEVPTDPPTRYRLNNSNQSLEFGTDGDGAPMFYYPFPFEVGVIQRDAEGGQFNMTVSASNISREIQASIEAYTGLIGQPVRIALISKALLAANKPILDFKGEILTHVASATEVSMEVGEPSSYKRKFPALRVLPHVCSFDYGGLLCGYDTTRSGALATCSKFLEGENGCREHGDDEEAAGLTVRHPARFGGYPGVPRATGAGL